MILLEWRYANSKGTHRNCPKGYHFYIAKVSHTKRKQERKSVESNRWTECQVVWTLIVFFFLKIVWWESSSFIFHHPYYRNFVLSRPIIHGDHTVSVQILRHVCFGYNLEDEENQESLRVDFCSVWPCLHNLCKFRGIGNSLWAVLGVLPARDTKSLLSDNRPLLTVSGNYAGSQLDPGLGRWLVGW